MNETQLEGWLENLIAKQKPFLQSIAQDFKKQTLREKVGSVNWFTGNLIYWEKHKISGNSAQLWNFITQFLLSFVQLTSWL